MLNRIIAGCLIATLCFIAALSGCSGGGGDDGSTPPPIIVGMMIAGTVYDIDTEQFVPNVTVTIKLENEDVVVVTEMTDSFGAYYADTLDCNTTYRLYFTGAGYHAFYAGKVTIATSYRTGVNVGIIPSSVSLTFINETVRNSGGIVNKWLTSPTFYLSDFPAALQTEVTADINSFVPSFTCGFWSSGVQTGTDPSSLPGYDGGSGMAPGYIIIEYSASPITATYDVLENNGEITGGWINIDDTANPDLCKALFCHILVNAGFSTVYADSYFANPITAIAPSREDMVIGKIAYGTYKRPIGNYTPDNNPDDYFLEP